MSAIIPVITDAGLQAVFNTSSTGLQAEIDRIGLGVGRYTPLTHLTALQSEQQRVPVAGGERTGPKTIALGAIVQGDSEYWVNEVGFYLTDGTLFAVWSDPDRSLAFKSADTDLILSFDLALFALPADSVSVVSSAPEINLSVVAEFAALAVADLSAMNTHLKLQQRIAALEKRVKTLEAS